MQAPIDAARQRKAPSYQHIRPADPGFADRIPIDHSPDTIDPESKLQADAKGRRALQQLWDVHSKIIDTAKAVTNKAKLAAEVEPVVARAGKAAKEELAVLERHIAHQEGEVRKALGTGMGPLQAEIRQHIKSLKPNERNAFVREAIQSGEIAALQAIFAVPHFLSGLDRDTYIELRALGEVVVAPEAVAERKAASANWTRLARAVEHFEATMGGNLKRWRNTDDQKIHGLMASLQPKEGE